MLATLRLATPFALCAPALAQATFVDDTSSIPQGSPFNLNDTEQVEFGDLDLDGDFDVVSAEGGDFGNQQNRLWINNGFAQGGTPGTFADETALRFPALLDTCRDLEFADLDGDGDIDLHTAATSAISNQPCRWWINMGGAQGGSAGYFQDQTAARWVGIAGAGSSIHPSLLLGVGGFIDFTSDADFADFDSDGDPDLFHSAVGGAHTGNVPTRVFLNDGEGAFSEFNPSGFQLAGPFIANGNPGLWCDGRQQANTTNTTGSQCDIASTFVDTDLGDFDGDFDLDAVGCGDTSVYPRVYRCRRVENGGVLGFRDLTAGSFTSGYPTSTGQYEQELGDTDDDGDLDLFGLNWGLNFADTLLAGNGAGSFSSSATMPGSNVDDEEADFLDYDGDGDLDVFVANFSGQDRLYRNGLIGGGGWTNQTSTLPPENLIGRDADACDVDADGDADVFVANAYDARNHFLRNVTQIPDTRAPRIPLLEQVPNRSASEIATVVHAHVYDNAPDYVVAFMRHELEYSVAGGAFAAAPMTWSGGQVYRGEIPGQFAGTLAYRVRVTDLQGNVGLSSTLSFLSTGLVTYCTAGTTSNGCNAMLSSSGIASASAGAGFTLDAANVDGQRSGLFLYGLSGRSAQAWGASSSFLCVALPIQRTTPLSSGGTNGACDGTFTLDWNAYIAANPGAYGQPFAAGTVVDAQAWFRDPPSPKSTQLSDALEFAVAP